VLKDETEDETGWLWTEDDQIIILWAMRTREDMLEDTPKNKTEDTFKGPKLLTKSRKDDVPNQETALSTSRVIPIFGGVGYRTVPPVPYLAITYSTRQLEASDLAEHT